MRPLLLPLLLLLAGASPVIAQSTGSTRPAPSPASDSTHLAPAKPVKLRHADRYRQGPEAYLGSLHKAMQLAQEEPTLDTAHNQARASARARYRAQRNAGRTLWGNETAE